MVDHPGRDRYRGALVGALLGDCLGAPFEGRPGPVGDGELQRLLAGSGPLRYTDDTAMTIALAESLVQRGGVDEDHVAATFAEHFVREPWRGYGGGARRLLGRIARGADWRAESAAQFGGAGSFGNGAAMRVSPVGCHAAGDARRAAELARRTASVTHAHPVAGDGAAIQAAAVATLLATTTPAELDVVALLAELAPHAGSGQLCQSLGRIAEAVTGDGLSTEVIRGEIGTGLSAAEAVPAALACFAARPHSFEATVVLAIGLGGDTDTIASMAGALAGALAGEAAIPAGWAARAEGLGRVRGLADQLFALAGPT